MIMLFFDKKKQNLFQTSFSEQKNSTNHDACNKARVVQLCYIYYREDEIEKMHSGKISNCLLQKVMFHQHHKIVGYLSLNLK